MAKERRILLLLVGLICLPTAIVAAGQFTAPLSQLSNAVEHANSVVAAQLGTAAAVAQKQAETKQATIAAARAGAVDELARKEEDLQKQQQAAQTGRNDAREGIVKAANQFKTTVDKDLRASQTKWYALTLGAIVLTLAGGVAGLIKWSRVAGVCSLVAAAVVAVPSALPIRQDVDFYQFLSNQTYVLILETSVPPAPSADDIKGWNTKLQGLWAIYSNPPKQFDPESSSRRVVQPPTPATGNRP